jgi:hypothetical protein
MSDTHETIKIRCSVCRCEGILTVFDGQSPGDTGVVLPRHWTWNPNGEFDERAAPSCPSCHAETLRKKAMDLRSYASICDPDGHPADPCDQLERKLDYEYRCLTDGNCMYWNESRFMYSVKQFVEAGGVFRPIHDKQRAKLTAKAIEAANAVEPEGKK